MKKVLTDKNIEDDQRTKDLKKKRDKSATALLDDLSTNANFNEYVKYNDMLFNRNCEKDGVYSQEVIKLTPEEQAIEIKKALHDIALDNIKYCENYHGDESKYIDFVNRLHGFKKEWLAFKRTNVDNFNYYIAKAKFILENFSKFYRELLIDEYKEYIRTNDYENSKEIVKRYGGFMFPSTPEEDKKFLEGELPNNRIIKLKVLRMIEEREKTHQKLMYMKDRCRHATEMDYDEFLFKKRYVGILLNAYAIPELCEFAPLIDIRYMYGCSVIKTGQILLSQDVYGKNCEDRNKVIAVDKNKEDITAEDNARRGSVNNEIRKLENALAEYIMMYDKSLITTQQFLDMHQKADEELSLEAQKVELGRLIDEVKEQKRILLNLGSKPPKVKRK